VRKSLEKKVLKESQLGELSKKGATIFPPVGKGSRVILGQQQDGGRVGHSAERETRVFRDGL